MVSMSQQMWLWTNSYENRAWAVYEMGTVAVQNEGGGSSIYRAATGSRSDEKFLGIISEHKVQYMLAWPTMKEA